MLRVQLFLLLAVCNWLVGPENREAGQYRLGPGLKALALLLAFPRPEGLGSFRCELECCAFPPNRKERAWMGHPFFVRIGAS